MVSQSLDLMVDRAEMSLQERVATVMSLYNNKLYYEDKKTGRINHH
jgi:hypothetical protein